MKNIYLIFVVKIIFSVVLIITLTIGASIKANAQGQKNVTDVKESSQIKQSDSSRIIFNVPSVKCGSITWNDPIISNWLANYCMDKCNDPGSVGYKFSGYIKNSNKRWSLKVTVKTDKEYAQPVKFNPDNGTFEGKVYFDKTNRLDTPIKIMLRDSNRVVLETFIINLLE